MSSQRRLGFDIDDVLFRTTENIVPIYNQLHGTTLERDEWYESDLPLARWGVDVMKDAILRTEAIFESDSFVPAFFEDAPEVLAQLQAGGDELFAITGRPERIRRQTVDQLDRAFPGIFPNDRVFFTHHFNTEGKALTKSSIAKELELTHFTEDLPAHVRDLAAVGIKVIVFSDNYRWNQSIESPISARVSNWRQLGDYFRSESA